MLFIVIIFISHIFANSNNFVRGLGNDTSFTSLFEPTEESPNFCSSTLDGNFSSIPIIDVREELLEHTDDQFPEPEIIKVADGIYVAIGYDLANTIIIESTTGITIIDTLSEVYIAREVFDDYKYLRINDDRNAKTINRLCN